MRDIDKRNAQFFLQPRQDALHADHEIGIQRTQGFVQQENTWLSHKRPRECYALFLSSGELTDIPFSKFENLHPLQPLTRTCLAFLRRDLAHF